MMNVLASSGVYMCLYLSSSYFHWKLLIGGLVLVLLDSIVNFRLEYLYPVMMFMRSVYDSYKYQGFVSPQLHKFKKNYILSLE